MEQEIPLFLKENDPDLLIGVSKTLAALGIDNHNKDLLDILRKNGNPAVRAAMLEALGVLEKENIDDALNLGMRDPSQEVRETAVGLLGKLEIPEAQLPILVDAFFKTGSGGEQQRMLGVLGEMPLSKSEPILKNLIQKGKQNQLSPNVILDLIEAVEASKSEDLIAQLGQLKSGGHTVDAYQETLYGGRWWQGRSVFTNNPTAQCVRCHAVGGSGGKVGPPLDNIGKILTREQILESLIEPGARLAPGYGSVVITLKDGQKVTGILEEESKEALLIRTSDAEPMEIAASRIQKRENMPSAMPAMGLMISKRELRDLIEYLSSLKEDQQAMN